MADKKFIIEVRTKGFAKANRDMGNLDTSSKSYNKTADRMRGTTNGLQGSIGALRNRILVYTFAIGGAVGAMNKFVKAASGFQDVKTRLVGLTGSVEEAEIAFKAFNKIAATTPFALDDVVNAGAQLQAFGMDAKLTLRATTDLAAFMGTTAVEAASALGRAFAGGVGAADMLRDKGIRQIIADSQGITDITKITLPEFRVALLKAMTDPDGRISGSADRLSKTFTGAVRNMQDAITVFAAMVGDNMLGPLTTAANATEDMFRSMNPKRLAEISSALGVMATAFAILRFEAMLTVAVVGSFTKALKVIATIATLLGVDKLFQLMGTFDHLQESIDGTTTALEKQQAAYIAYLEEILAANTALNDQATALEKSETALAVRLAVMLEDTELGKARVALYLSEGKFLSATSIKILEQIDLLNAKAKVDRENAKATRDAEREAAKATRDAAKKLEEAAKARQKLIDDELSQRDALASSYVEMATALAELSGASEIELDTMSLKNDLYHGLSKVIGDQAGEYAKLIDMAKKNSDISELEKMDISGLTEAQKAHVDQLIKTFNAKVLLLELSDEEKAAIEARTEAQKLAEEAIARTAEAQKQQIAVANQLAGTINIVAGAMRNLGDEEMNTMQKTQEMIKIMGSLMMVLGAGTPVGAVGSIFTALGSIPVGHTGGLVKNDGIQRFAQGGMVQGRDNVPIMAQAGEFIMRREAVQNIGVQNLAQMNKTGQGGVTVNIQGNMIGNDEFVRDNLLPQIAKAARQNLA